MYAVIDHNNDGVADSVVTVVSNLTAPLGLAYANGSLWVATTPTIYRFDNVDALARAGKVKYLSVHKGFHYCRHCWFACAVRQLHCAKSIVQRAVCCALPPLKLVMVVQQAAKPTLQ